MDPGAGTWPDGVINETTAPIGPENPLDSVPLEESVSKAVLVQLERLTSAQRVAFVVHDVFGFSFAEVADTTGRSTGACRELVSQA